MSIDVERAVRAYAEYLDEILPEVTVADAQSSPQPLPLDRPRPMPPSPPWHRRPVVVFVGTVVAILAAVLVPVLLFADRGSDMIESPATTTSVPETTSTIPTTQPPSDVSNLPAVTLVPATQTEPVAVSTALGTIEFTTMQFPPDLEFALPYNLAGTGHGPVAVADETLWWSVDYETWHQTSIFTDSGFPTVDGDDVVVPGETGWTRFAWDGNEWVRASAADMTRQVDQVVFGPGGSVALSGDTLFFSTDDVSYVEASGGPDLRVFWAATDVPEEDRDFGDCRATFGAATARVRTVVATDNGFVAITSATHPGEDVCAPYLWFSPDGDTWDRVGTGSPFGEFSTVDIAPPWKGITAHDGRFLTSGSIGGMGEDDPEEVVWASDDAVTWERTSIEGLGGVVSIDAGELGWVLVDVRLDGLDGPVPRFWTSTDSRVWDGPYELPGRLTVGYLVPQIAVTTDAVVAVDVAEEVVVVGRLQEASGGQS